MKNTIFLTSSVDRVARDVVTHIENFHPGMKLAFIGTAAEVSEGPLDWQDADRQALVDAGYEVTDYTVTGNTEADLRRDLTPMDAIYVGGGNTFYLLQQMRVSGFDKVIHDLMDEGKIYIGTSAGSVVAGPDIFPVFRIDRADKAPLLNGDYTGLGLVDFVVMPHWGSDDFRDVYLNQRLEHAYTDKHRLILLTNNQYVRIAGDGMMKIEEVRHNPAIV